MLPVLITMGSLLIVSYIMQSPTTGMMNLLASDIAAVVGRFYPAAAVLIGSSGSFITGTGLGSNIMFAEMHIDAAAVARHEPHHHLRRSERGRFPRQPYLPEQHRRRLRDRGRRSATRTRS